MDSILFRDRFLPGVSVDCLILSFTDGQFHLLLLKWTGMKYWDFPAGFIGKTEAIEHAAVRTIQAQLSVDHISTRQFYIFGNPTRKEEHADFTQGAAALIEKTFKIPDAVDWFSQRFVTIGFLSTTLMDNVNPKLDPLHDRWQWFSMDNLPQLMYDHDFVIQTAMTYLKNHINDIDIISGLLPSTFTLLELRKLHEAILGCQLDRGNFQRKIQAAGILNRQKKLMNGAPHRSPYVYSFNI